MEPAQSRPLATMFVDLNAYFASVEQHLRPELRGRPVGVAPVVAETTCCIAASYEAKRHGVRTGTGVREARRMCPEIAIVAARPREYVVMHHRILEVVSGVIPIGAVHSIDEFSVDLLGRERERGEAERIAREVKRAIRDRIGETMRCSIGIASNRLLAKLASDMEKPDGLVVIESGGLPDRLRGIAVTDIPGVGPRMGERLRVRGIETFEQLWSVGVREMGAIWGGVTGRILYHRLRGEEPSSRPTRKRTIGHQHVLAPTLRTADGARAVVARLTHKAAARMRFEGYWARRVGVSVMMVDGAGWGADAVIPETQDTLTVLEVVSGMWSGVPGGTPMRVGVVLMDLVPHTDATAPLFPESARRVRLARAMDLINRHHGHDTVYFAGMHGARESAPMRIAFQTIPDLDLPDVQEV